jgi:uncharacterized UPF0146 family protein
VHEAARQLTQRPSGFPPFCSSALALSPIHPLFPSPLPSPLPSTLPMNSHRGRRRSKPFAFIEFTDIDEAHDAKDQMDRREFQGRVIEVGLGHVIEVGLGRVIEVGLGRVIEVSLGRVVEVGLGRVIEVRLGRVIEVGLGRVFEVVFARQKRKSTVDEWINDSMCVCV